MFKELGRRLDEHCEKLEVFNRVKKYKKNKDKEYSNWSSLFASALLQMTLFCSYQLYFIKKIFNSITKIKNTLEGVAAKSLQLCPTLWDHIDGSPPGSLVPRILQARTLEWVAISFSNAWKWKVKVKLLSRVRLLVTPWTAAHQAPPPMGFSRQEYWSGVPSPSPLEGVNSRLNDTEEQMSELEDRALKITKQKERIKSKKKWGQFKTPQGQHQAY